MWFPGLSGELSSLGALGEGGQWLEEPGVRGASQQGLEARGETPPHTLAEGPQEQRYRGGNWSRPPGAECLGGTQGQTKDWNGQPGG